MKKGSIEIASDTAEQTGTEYGKVAGKDIKLASSSWPNKLYEE